MAFDNPTFECREERPDAQTLILVVEGELHLSTAPAFGAHLTKAIAHGSGATVLDLAGVGFIDSTGLSILLNGLRRITRAGGRLALVVANPTVLRLFEITRLDETFDILPTREAALERVRNGAERSV